MLSMQLPREVLYGNGVIEDIGNLCKRLNFGSPILVTSGRTTYKIAGEKVTEILTDSNYKIFDCIISSPSIQEVNRVKEMIRETSPSVLIGVGGGKVIDVTKMASAKMDIDFISVPTCASHDGIASPRASISNYDDQKVSVHARTPIAIVADTKIISKAPEQLLKAGCGDIIANSTAVRDWELAYKLRNEEYSEYASALSKMTSEIIINQAKNIKKGLEESVRLVVKALISSGVAMSIAGSSRPASGSEHKFSHALDMIAPKPALHGEQCGVGTILMMKLHGGNWLEIKEALDTIGLPTTAKELGIEEEFIIEALTKAHLIRPERYTILGDKGIKKEAAERLARETGVI